MPYMQLIMKDCKEDPPGHTAVWQVLIRDTYKADINVTDKLGLSILYHAAEAGKFDIVEALIERGADVNLADKNKQTILHHAAGKGNFEIIRRMYDLGADVFVSDVCGKSPLDIAIKMRHKEATEWLTYFSLVSLYLQP